MFIPEYAEFERVLASSYPRRFTQRRGEAHQDFPGQWAFALLEASVERCTRVGQAVDANSPAVEEVVRELIGELSRDVAEVICCRVVPHLETANGEPVSVAGVEVIPIDDERVAVPRLVPGTLSAFGDRVPWVFDRPKALLVARGSGWNPYAVGSDLSRRLERFLLAARLMTGTSAWVAGELVGPSSLHWVGPQITRSNRQPGWVRRTGRIGAEQEASIAWLDEVISRALSRGSDMVFDSFQLAISRFGRTYDDVQAWDSQVVDLVTALEAIASGQDTENLLLRLRVRTAALLECDSDRGRQIFDDIGRLYDLRSKLVHGGRLRRGPFMTLLRSVSGVGEKTPPGVAIAYVVDRLRDIVRRFLLVRLALGFGDEPAWPFGRDDGVDKALLDGISRSEWRERWRSVLSGAGLEGAALPPGAAVDVIQDYAGASVTTKPSGDDG